MPATVESVLAHLGLSQPRPADDASLDQAVKASNDLVAVLRPDLTATEPWAPRADQAAIQYAARLYGRRGSITGIAAFAEAGVALLPRTDPDVAQLLELGSYQKSVVA